MMLARAEIEDGGLAAALEAGDEDRAMELLAAGHGDHVYRYCRRMLGNDADGDDISQAVFVQAFQGLESFSQVRSARAWLLGIARHRCLDHLKAVRRGPRVLAEEDLRAVADRHPVDPAAADPRVHQALDDCLDRLDARSRALLVLRFHDELSYDEISALTSDTPGALRVRVARALPALRQCLEGKGVAP